MNELKVLTAASLEALAEGLVPLAYYGYSSV